MKQRVYIDTSVIGGCLDEEFKEASRKLVEKFKRGDMIAVISELTVLELKDAPEEVQKVFSEIPEENTKYVELTEEAVNLAQNYISEKVVGRSKLVDAEHIAIATINRVDAVVSWNFKHIVNLVKIRGFNAVNLKMGYPLLEIRSPWEVIIYEEGEEV
ncbi:MAG: PIN domain protein [Candidatus Jordarchaeum sp.]|uniref:PIN domain protein n=1 Tax=Candidatus Jordarchaeum sp. TaxID=2823881 RepID=UPI00404AEF27